jgi:hypothetical protein
LAVLPPSDKIYSDRQSLPDLTNALRVSPGGEIMLQFQENGHITLQMQDSVGLGKLGPGEVFVYGTSDSRPDDTLLGVHHSWTQDGTGGDQRGRLLEQGPFDDGVITRSTQVLYQSSVNLSIPMLRPLRILFL